MPIKAADIAYQSRIDSYNVSRAVKSLQNKGLIEVQLSEQSRNIKFLILNEQGTQLYHKVINSMEIRATELESALDENEQVQFYQMLEKIENKAEQLLAEQALDKISDGENAPADQKELIRWYKKSNQTS
jgi:DNA-binding MarR family transcriptional regulator